jgi:hypothetical protein
MRIAVQPGLKAKFFPPRVPLYDVPSRPGDLVIWNLRTLHAAGFRALQAHPEIAMHPAVEAEMAAKWPDLLRPVAGPRLALFFDLAAPAEDVDLYIKSRTRIIGPSDRTRFLRARYDGPDVTEKLRARGISARYDHLMIYLLVRWIEFPSEGGEIRQRVLDLADRHREFSPHYALFDRRDYALFRGRNNARAFDIVVEGICRHSSVLRKKLDG